MPRLTRNLPSLLLPMLLLAAGPAGADDGTAEQIAGVAGKVLGQSSPLAAARVYAYQLADLSLHEVVTDETGGFVFSELPAGLYKVIAHKSGFVPAVVMLTRPDEERYQFLEVELAPRSPGADTGRDDFWAARSQIPPDVLRDITIAEMEHSSAYGSVELPRGVQLRAEMQAMAGTDQIAALGEGQMTAGSLGLEGRLGGLEIGLSGNFRELAASGVGETALGPNGQTSALSLNLESGDATQVRVTSLSNRLGSLDQATGAPVDFEHYRVSVTQALGPRGQSEFAAGYTSESNFHRHGWFDPMSIPSASETWRVEGSYQSTFGEATTVETGLRYRERSYELDSPRGPAHKRVEFFGQGGTRLQPAVLVEYGLYTTLRDGSLSFVPRGGLVVRLSESWKASTTISHTVQDAAEERLLDFAPLSLADTEGCNARETHCYRLLFSRTNEDQEEISFGATHREYAETLRLYFSDDFFDRLESLYLVPGDELPELQFAVSQRLSPNVLTRFESNLATGGGGIFYATDRERYENSVRYLVTSLDTRFQETATGLFLAFHHLQQELDPLSPFTAGPAPLELERFQVMLTQDLHLLLNLTREWAVKLNMEISRGTTPYGLPNDEELRKRILGGIAVRF